MLRVASLLLLGVALCSGQPDLMSALSGGAGGGPSRRSDLPLAPPPPSAGKPAPGPKDHEFDTYDYDSAQDNGPPPPPPKPQERPVRLRGNQVPQNAVGGLGGPSLDCREKTRTLPHEKFCDLYYTSTACEGESAQSLLRSCPNGLLYTGSGRPGLIGVCDYPHNVECNGKERHNPPQQTEHCDYLYGIFGHETSCTRYWTCWNGTATEQFCVGGLLYNEETHACDWPQNVGGCQKHPLCKDDANGNVPLGKSCNRYWSCQGGYPRLQRCPAMLVFDKIKKRCVAPPTEDCEVPPSTAAPGEAGEGEEIEGEEGAGPQGPEEQQFQGQQGGRPQLHHQQGPPQVEQRRRGQQPQQQQAPILLDRGEPAVPGGSQFLPFQIPDDEEHVGGGRPQPN